MRKIVDDVIAKQRANQNVKALQEYFFQKDTIEKKPLALSVFEEQKLHFSDLTKCKEEVEEARNMQLQLEVEYLFPCNKRFRVPYCHDKRFYIKLFIILSKLLKFLSCPPS